MSTGYVQRGHTYGHREVVEVAMGKSLPPGACVHHIDGDKRNNSPSNLVVCPSQAYHSLLHFRARALEETGHAGSLRCGICLEWIPPWSPDVTGKPGNSRHRSCNSAYMKEQRRRRAMIEAEKVEAERGEGM